MASEVLEKAKQAQAAAAILALASEEEKNRALSYMAAALEAEPELILAANREDVLQVEGKGMAPAMLDRLTLTAARIRDMADGVRQVAALPDPTGAQLAAWERPNGLQIERVAVPLGVIAIIFESRPNVTVDAAALCLKTGNACILRGGSEAIRSNLALAAVLQESLQRAGLPRTGLAMLENTDRALVRELLTLRAYIDLAIPRGGAGLIRMVVDTATVPVIETGSGICHVYVDAAADLDMAARIVENAKISRPSTCNSMETLLLHREIAKEALRKLVPLLTADGVEMRGDGRSRSLDAAIAIAGEDAWHTEYNALIMSVKIVDSFEEAVEHINRYGTHHSDCIVTDNAEVAEAFLRRVDSAAVYVNASTRFTDGFEFGFGAEIGISTQKLHVRGPMGLQALLTYKYNIRGQGQIRV